MREVPLQHPQRFFLRIGSHGEKETGGSCRFVLKAHTLWWHSSLGSRVIKKREEEEDGGHQPPEKNLVGLTRDFDDPVVFAMLRPQEFRRG